MDNPYAGIESVTDLETEDGLEFHDDTIAGKGFMRLERCPVPERCARHVMPLRIVHAAGAGSVEAAPDASLRPVVLLAKRMMEAGGNDCPHEWTESLSRYRLGGSDA